MPPSLFAESGEATSTFFSGTRAPPPHSKYERETDVFNQVWLPVQTSEETHGHAVSALDGEDGMTAPASKEKKGDTVASLNEMGMPRAPADLNLRIQSGGCHLHLRNRRWDASSVLSTEPAMGTGVTASKW